VLVFSGPPKAPWHSAIPSLRKEDNTWSESQYHLKSISFFILTTHSIWLWFRTGGPMLGSAIVLGLNQ
jgi:hypothetical protein